MSAEPGHSDRSESNLERFRGLRSFEGPIEDFWAMFVERSARLMAADAALLLVLEDECGPWRLDAVWTSQGHSDPRLPSLTLRAEVIAQASARLGSFHENWPLGDVRDGVMTGVRVNSEADDIVTVLAVLIAGNPIRPVHELDIALELAAEVAYGWLRERAARRSRIEVPQFQEALDLMVLLNDDRQFAKGALTLVNEIASRHQCNRVSLGWLEKGYTTIKAVSQTEAFEGKTDAVQALECAMEETIDQDVEVVWPRPEGLKFVARAHEAYSQRWGNPYLVSMPLRLDGNPVGVLTCERSSLSFGSETIGALRLNCDQVTRRLDDLKTHDRWVGAQLMSLVRNALSRLLGVENTGLKLIAMVVATLIAIVTWGQWTYRIEGACVLRPDDLMNLPVPFDGYIQEAYAQLGDVVRPGELLVALDTRELILEESSALAEISRCETQEEKARAGKELADMKVAQAQREQAHAKLATVRHRLASSRITAPFGGIVVEGDLKKMLGAPVRRGDLLHKVARVENLYAEIEIDERDVHDIHPGTTGEVALLTRPNLSFPVKVDRIEPVGTAKDGANIFVARATLVGSKVGWWRPGMSGVAKLHVGDRPIRWILTHSTVDTLRMWLWW